MSGALRRLVSVELVQGTACNQGILDALQNARVLRGFARHGSEGASTSASRLPRGDAAVAVSRPTHSQPPKEDPEVEREELMRQAAQSATASMFPWERRQMDGSGKINTFEKVYWAAFGCAVVYLVVVNGWRYYSKRQEPKVDVDLEGQKSAMALRLAREGLSVLQCEDLLEGLTPQEIAELVDRAKQEERDKRHSSLDEFDGMSPEEINAAVAARQRAA